MEIVDPARADGLDWLAAVVVGASIVLALVTIRLMFHHARPTADDPVDRPPVVFDPVLLGSAVAVILLALAAWLLR